MPTLYIVATPIGNLEDISMRALRVLGEVDFILCEDTRVTRVLLDRYNIKTRTISYHQHSNENKVSEIINLLIQGKNLALVSDAGTPGISDPGGKLVQAVLEKFGSEIYPVKSPLKRGAEQFYGVNPVKSPLKRGAEQFYGVNPVKSRSAGITPEAELFDGVKIESVPGPSAVTAALSISGIPTDKFIFLGFPPHKKGRQTFIRKILVSDYPVVVYESKHRIVKFLQELQEAVEKNLVVDGEKANQELGIRNNGKGKTPSLTSVVVCRELSKMHETVYRGDLKSIMEKIKLNKNDQKGEFVVIIGK